MKPRHAIKYLIELDGVTYGLKGRQARRVEDPAAVHGETWLVTNFQEAITRRMIVEGPRQHAELLVRRKVQESGEFEEPVHIITHWKHKHGKSATDIFFTAMPTRVADFYFQGLRQQADLTLVVPLYALLWEIAKHAGRKEPLAVVLRHDRFAEVLVADGKRVYFATRCVAFDNEPEQIRALWETIGNDISEVEREQRIQVGRVLCLNWLGSEEEPLVGGDWDRHLITAEAVDLNVDGVLYRTSWPKALQRLKIGLSASPVLDRCFYVGRRLAPVFNLLLSAALVLLAAGVFVLQQRGRDFQMQSTDVEQQIRRLASGQAGLGMPAKFPKLVGFVDNLDRQRRLPAYRRIVADLTRAGFEGLTLQQLNIEYAGDQVEVAFFAEIETPFDQAQAGYQKMIRRLKAAGYTVVEHTFETRIASSKVVLKLRRAAVI